ncbi:MAG: sulfatase [Candidatus Woesearchaeota archaeon]
MRSIFAAAIIGFLLLSACNKEEEFLPDSLSCKGCNIVVITMDSLRADRLGCYGYPLSTSPNIDKFAEKSIIFSDATSICGSTFCAIPALMTSKYPYTDNLMEGLRLKQEAVTISEILRKEGYDTRGVVTVSLVNSESGNMQGFDYYDDIFIEYEPAKITRRRAEKSLENAVEPFFIWVHFWQPHEPYTPSSYSRTIIEAQSRLFGNIDENKNKEPSTFRIYGLDTSKEIVEKQNRRKENLKNLSIMYDASIYDVDNEVGKFLKKLEPFKNRTIIIITSDHGELLGEYEAVSHNNLYYEGLHVPLIIHHPNNAHLVINKPIMSVDIVPTILDMLEIKIDYSFRGENLFETNREFQYAEYSYGYAVKKGDVQLIKFPEPIIINISDPTKRVQNQKELIEELGSLAPKRNFTYNGVDEFELLRSIGYIG